MTTPNVCICFSSEKYESSVIQLFCKNRDKLQIVVTWKIVDNVSCIIFTLCRIFPWARLDPMVCPSQPTGRMFGTPALRTIKKPQRNVAQLTQDL